MRIDATNAVSGRQKRASSSVGLRHRDSLQPTPGNPILGLQSTHGNRAVLQMLDRSNEGLFALMQGLRRLEQVGEKRVNLPTATVR